jgi:hypothetical protein
MRVFIFTIQFNFWVNIARIWVLAILRLLDVCNMKKLLTIIILVLCLFAGSLSVFAQDSTTLRKKHLIQIAPIGLAFQKVRLSYEYVMNKDFTFGSSYTFYFEDTYLGHKINPNVKYFFGREAPNGLYLSLQLPIGVFKQELIPTSYAEYNRFGGFVNSGNKHPTSSNLIDKISATYGVQLNIGYQLLTGRKKNIPLNLTVGIQFLKDIEFVDYYTTSTLPNGNLVEQYYENKNTVGVTGLFTTFGPGSYFSPSFTCGYAF